MKDFISSEERGELAKKGSYVGIIGNLMLALLKFSIGILSGSLAIIADGIDTSTDIITSFLTLIAAKISNKPADFSHPYGHERAETITTKILSIIVLFAGYQVLVSAIKNLLSGNKTIENPLWVLLVAAISVIIKYLLYNYKLKIGKKINSSSFIADALNMRNDIFTSLAVFIGILIFYFTGIPWIDSVIAIFVSIIIFKVGIEMFIETSDELMDGSKELGDIYKMIINICDEYSEIQNPHKIRVRKSGFVYFLEFHIEVNPNMIIKEANKLTFKLEKEIKEYNPYIKDIIIHVEPFENIENEEFGLDKDSINKLFNEK